VWFLALAVCCLGYLFGSFPAGYFAGRIAGIDVRSAGSGNIGATNVLRVLGKPWGYTVFFIDAFKGFAAVRVAFFLAERLTFARPQAVILCVVGHTFPVWLRFKGGKGVATSVGAIFGLMPLVAITIFLIWAIVFEITRYVSVASIIAASSCPLVVVLLLHWKLIEGIGLLYFAIVMAIFIVWRHRSNFSRLLNGTEQRFTRK
jgi:acyl phosphate:glycerol-3-phosphate acyltransferase